MMRDGCPHPGVDSHPASLPGSGGTPWCLSRPCAGGRRGRPGASAGVPERQLTAAVPRRRRRPCAGFRRMPQMAHVIYRRQPVPSRSIAFCTIVDRCTRQGAHGDPLSCSLGGGRWFYRGWPCAACRDAPAAGGVTCPPERINHQKPPALTFPANHHEKWSQGAQSHPAAPDTGLAGRTPEPSHHCNPAGHAREWSVPCRAPLRNATKCGLSVSPPDISDMSGGLTTLGVASCTYK
jgi:hypothetical protein